MYFYGMNQILTVLLLAVTLAASAQTTVYSEDFQNGLPMSYTIIDNDMHTPDASTSDFADAWVALVDPDNPLDTIVGSTSYFSPIARADRWLITPPITLGAFGNILKWEAKSHDASYLDGYDIYISITDTDLNSFIDTLGAVTLENATWTSREINLSDAGYNNQTVHIAFVNRTYDGFKLYLDDIQMVIDDPVSIEENILEGVSLYPNPSTGTLNVTCDMSAKVTVRSMAGAEVYKGQGSKHELATLNSGVYLVSVRTDSASKTMRWIKK
jgi:hypothetical protein